MRRSRSGRSWAAGAALSGAALAAVLSPTVLARVGGTTPVRPECSLGVEEAVGAPFRPAEQQAAAVTPSTTCAMCHDASANSTAMRDAAGRSVAPYDLWRGSMMANAARDPFWRAVMSAEIAAAPHAKNAIVEKCLGCHAPMAARVGLDDHGTGDPLHALDCDGELGDLARDSVSCTICHGMLPDGLGTPASFTAGFELDPQRRLFGPHGSPVTGPMRNHTGFTPTEADHITSSAMCGSCHTLITEALDAEGEPTDIQFHEQSPFLEWRNSAFSVDGPNGRTCQQCHVPRTDVDGTPISTELAHNPGGGDFPFLSERAPYGRHLFVGGNAFMLTLLRDNAELLDVVAPAEAFDATIAATRDQLAHRTAMLAVRSRGEVEGRIAFDVTVTNLTGHKLPTGHPSRRMWLEVVVADAEGREIYVSGRPDGQGRILGADGAPLPTELRGGPVEPHRELIRAQDEVVRYRAVMEDTDGRPTHTLMRGATWAVDDRILPRGWRADHPDAAAAMPYGTGDDRDYTANAPAAGQDRVRYEVERRGTAPFTVRARLLYQTASPRWIDEIAVHDTPEILRFTRLVTLAGNAPEVLAETESDL